MPPRKRLRKCIKNGKHGVRELGPDEDSTDGTENLDDIGSSSPSVDDDDDDDNEDEDEDCRKPDEVDAIQETGNTGPRIVKPSEGKQRAGKTTRGRTAKGKGKRKRKVAKPREYKAVMSAASTVVKPTKYQVAMSTASIGIDEEHEDDDGMNVDEETLYEDIYTE